MPSIGSNLSLEPPLDEEDYIYEEDQEKDDFDENSIEELQKEKEFHNGEIEAKYEKNQKF